jgi:hypothetical protein
LARRVLLFHVGQDEVVQRVVLARRGRRNETAHRREPRVRVVVVVSRQPDLLQVVRALDASGGLAHLLHGGQQEADQHRDDGDDDEQFDECEALLGGPHGSLRVCLNT